MFWILTVFAGVRSPPVGAIRQRKRERLT